MAEERFQKVKRCSWCFISLLPVEERGFISAHNLKGKAVLVEVAVGVAGGFGIWSLQSLVTL